MPGDFCVTVNGVADITVSHELIILAALKQDVLIERYDRVLACGPVSERLREIASINAPRLKERLEISEDDASEGLAYHLEIALARILFHTQRYKHGGALLLAGLGGTSHLNVKHGITYDRLTKAVVDMAYQAAQEGMISHFIYGHLLPANKSVPPEAFREYARTDFAMRDSMSEMAGCVRFIASLSRVDGLVLMDRSLGVSGFGVEIVGVPEVETIHVPSDESGEVAREVAANDFGTRHRSMFRYCNAHADSVGFVVSQDGLIRAIMRVGDRLLMWENIQVLSSVHEGDDVEERICPHCQPDTESQLCETESAE